MQEVDGWIVNYIQYDIISERKVKYYSELSKQNIHGVHKHVNHKLKKPKIKAWDVKQ